MEESPSRRKYVSRLFSSIGALWSAQETLRFKNIRRSHLQYFFALPMAMIFANIQEVMLRSEYGFFGLDPVTLSSGSFCIGAGVLFIFAKTENLSFISKLSAGITVLGFVPWLILPDSAASLAFAMVFMAGAGGCAMSGAYSYVFALNNAERFWGTALISVFYGLSRMNAGFPLLSPTGVKIILTMVISGTIVCLMRYRTADFTVWQNKKGGKFNTPIWLTVYLFLVPSYLSMFYTYIPGTSEASAVVISGIVGVAAVLLAVLVQMLSGRSTWTHYSLFFISMVGAYALLYAPADSALRTAAYALRGIELIGYMLGFYVIGCVCNKFGDFRMFKRVVIAVMPLSVLMYLIPDLLAETPGVLHAVAMTSAAVSLVLFLLMAPAFSRHLFSADWSDDFRKRSLSEANKQVEQADRFESLALTQREKEIAALLLRGMAIKQVAAQLDISFDTAKFHIKNLYKKLGIGGRTELFARFGVSPKSAEEKEPAPR